jgi:hypothetical protein
MDSMNKPTAWLSALVLLSATAVAETMETRGIGPAPAGSPTNGMSMDRVLQRHGEPAERMAPVGDPPITRWVYPDYTVYFERELVLTSVGNR